MKSSVYVTHSNVHNSFSQDSDIIPILSFSQEPINKYIKQPRHMTPLPYTWLYRKPLSQFTIHLHILYYHYKNLTTSKSLLSIPYILTFHNFFLSTLSYSVENQEGHLQLTHLLYWLSYWKYLVRTPSITPTPPRPCSFPTTLSVIALTHINNYSST